MDAKARSTNEKVRYHGSSCSVHATVNSILQKRINEITTLDIERVLRPVWWDKPETGHEKLLVRLRRVFDYARVQLRDRHGIAMPHNPAAWQDLRDRGFDRISKLSRGRQAALDYPWRRTSCPPSGNDRESPPRHSKLRCCPGYAPAR